MKIMAKTAAQTRTASKAPLSLKVTLYGTKPPGLASPPYSR
jgi:hypothetical protein